MKALFGACAIVVSSTRLSDLEVREMFWRDSGAVLERLETKLIELMELTELTESRIFEVLSKALESA